MTHPTNKWWFSFPGHVIILNSQRSFTSTTLNVFSQCCVLKSSDNYANNDVPFYPFARVTSCQLTLISSLRRKWNAHTRSSETSHTRSVSARQNGNRYRDVEPRNVSTVTTACTLGGARTQTHTNMQTAMDLSITTRRNKEIWGLGSTHIVMGLPMLGT